MHDFLDFHFLVTLRVQNREKMRNFFYPYRFFQSWDVFQVNNSQRLITPVLIPIVLKTFLQALKDTQLSMKNILKPSKLSKITIKKSIKFPEYRDNKNKNQKKNQKIQPYFFRFEFLGCQNFKNNFLRCQKFQK